MLCSITLRKKKAKWSAGSQKICLPFCPVTSFLSDNEIVWFCFPCYFRLASLQSKFFMVASVSCLYVHIET